MFYKPKFCCQCAEPIERANRNLFTSRRFCELCATDYKLADLVPKIIVGAGILFGILGLGTFLRKAEKPLNLASSNFVGNTSNTNKSIVNTAVSINANAQSFTKTQNANQAVAAPTGKLPTVPPMQEVKSRKVENLPGAAQETVYFCGAETKKGTPCTRRVKGGGRCFQHIGKPAMLPPDKLVASR